MFLGVPDFTDLRLKSKFKLLFVYILLKIWANFTKYIRVKHQFWGFLYNSFLALEITAHVFKQTCLSEKRGVKINSSPKLPYGTALQESTPSVILTPILITFSRCESPKLSFLGFLELKGSFTFRQNINVGLKNEISAL